jgi:hypothetical protein
LSHPDNGALRAALHGGALTRVAYFQQLLRLVYRLIFLLTVEERDLLHPLVASDQARTLYAAGYALQRLRDRSLKRNAHDRFSDLWAATTIVFRGLASGEPRLGLPALAGLFDASQCQDLDRARLENRALLSAMYRLAWLKHAAGVVRVNWRDMGPEELGSVYESLLELQPQISQEGRTFTFAETSEAKGNARKTTGSYYTPDSLVQVLLRSALDPVITDAIAKNPGKEVQALLNITIVDPACGSGHFLLAAGRRLAAHVARLQVEGTPSAVEYRRALRQVIGRSIFGVDLNPMAVELCKVSLWMEAVDPGLPLTFLNSHIQRGNALLGTTPQLMSSGIPDAAWDPIEGDDKKIATALKRRNKAEAAGQRALDFGEPERSIDEVQALASAVIGLEATGDEDASALAEKEVRWNGILESEEYRHQKLVADAWCAAFVWHKVPGDLAVAAPTNESWRRLRDSGSEPLGRTATIAIQLSEQYGFFHWHLQFPQVFAKGGFSVVLGNPPWERVKLQEQEFFASRSDKIANAQNAAVRKRFIAELPEEDAALWAEWCTASRSAAGTKHFLRESGRYPLCGQGDVNTYAIFAEHNRQILSSRGAAGFIVPTGIVTDDATRDYFLAVMSARELYQFLSFENESKIFPAVHHAFKFALFVINRSLTHKSTEFVFFARSVDEIDDVDRKIHLAIDDLELLNPHTKSALTFRSRHDAELTRAVHDRLQTLRPKVAQDGWTLDLRRMIHMADDAGLFKSASELQADGWSGDGNEFVKDDQRMVPLYEAKLVHYFDHRFATYEGQTEAQASQGKCPELSPADHADPLKYVEPRYWIPKQEVDDRLAGSWSRGWILGWRDICRSVDQRTMIVSLIPRAAIGGFHQIRVHADPADAAGLYACLCSFVADYIARQKVSGTHLTYGILEQVPAISPQTLAQPLVWCKGQTVRAWLAARVLELAYTSWDLQPFALDIGYDGPPFRWDAARRFTLRCELDAAFFHFYGLARDDTSYVMDTFPIVRKIDEKVHGTYRTKDTILEIYDAMAEAARTGGTYQARLRPADPLVAHPPRVSLPVIPKMPSVVPSLPPSQDGAILIWAILHADRGAIRRSDLARAFALRNRPELLARLAPAAVKAVAIQWAKARGTATTTGTLAGVLTDLAARSGVDVAVDAEGRSLVKLNANAPALDRIDDWYRFEASLVVHVLKSLPAANVAAVDAAVAGDDRALLAS